MIGKPISEYKCLTCEFYTESRAQMMEHQFVQHQKFFDPEKNKPEMVSQLGHTYWHVKVLDHGGIVWETVSTQLDPKEEKLPTGNLTDQSLMPFGKHKGEKMEDVPVKYLHWIFCNAEKKPFNRGVFTYIQKNIAALKLEDLDLIWKPIEKSKT